MKIATIGAGYVGLVTGACLAELGHHVLCIDTDANRIARLTDGIVPIYEPGLDALILRNVQAGRIGFSTDLAGSVADRDAVFIAVGTPSDPATGHADLRFVRMAATDLGRHIRPGTVVVTKSTVPVGTNRIVLGILSAAMGLDDVAVASNPEFLREGSAIRDFMEPDRIVVGSDSGHAMEVMAAIYEPLTRRGRPLIQCDLESAEVIKYAANAFLAVKLSYINEIADLCEAVGANVDRVAMGIGSDRRIGETFLRPGPGWGGSCFPKDTRALTSTAADHGVAVGIVDAAIAANVRRKAAVLKRITAAAGGSLQGAIVAVLGLTFKGETDDLRESPSMDIARGLLAAGALVHAYDPSMPRAALDELPGLKLMGSAEQAAEGAHLLAVMTEWTEFATLDLPALADAMNDPVMIDLRNMFDPAAVATSGFRSYRGIGRPSANRIASIRHDVGTGVSPIERAPLPLPAL